MIQFTVYGKPEPQGSSRAVSVKGYARPFITSANKKLKPWRQEIANTAAAVAVQLGIQPIAKEIPIAMSLNFYFEKPPSVSKRRVHPTVKPDVDKLIRGILDSLTGIIYVDDSQVVRFDEIQKHYGVPQRVEITVREIGQ